MERTYICIDCGKEFTIESKRNTHAKRCPECRRIARLEYDKRWKQQKRESDPNYAANMRLRWEDRKFSDNPKDFYINRILRAAKSRAKKEGIPFNLTKEDIEIPEVCPVLGIRLELKVPSRGERGNWLTHFNSPSIDKIIPDLGYVKDNVWIIGYRANSLKRDASFEEIERLYNAMVKLKSSNFKYKT